MSKSMIIILRILIWFRFAKFNKSKDVASAVMTNELNEAIYGDGYVEHIRQLHRKLATNEAMSEECLQKYGETTGILEIKAMIKRRKYN